MARPLRVNVTDGWYHCMHRGIERRRLFTEKREHDYFLGLLGETVERFRFRVHAYCLMGNHYHAIVQTPDANLSQGMQWLGQSYSSWYNAQHRRVGPLFQGRFKSVPVENGTWALELSIYIHLNPVRIEALGLDKRSRRAASMGILPPPSREVVTTRLKSIEAIGSVSRRCCGKGWRSRGWNSSVRGRGSVAPGLSSRSRGWRKEGHERPNGAGD